MKTNINLLKKKGEKEREKEPDIKLLYTVRQHLKSAFTKLGSVMSNPHPI